MFLFLFVFQPSSLIAQIDDDDLFSFMNDHLTANEKDQIAKAKTNIEKGDKLSSQISEEESKISKYAKKKKKYEKKSVDVKFLRIKQALYYEKGFGVVYNVYGEKLGECVFLYEDDEARVNDLQEEASNDMTSAKKKIKPYQTIKESDLKKSVVFSKLKSDLKSSLDLNISSVKKLIEAYAIYLEQENKKQLEEEEKRVWDNALSENSIVSFQNYLDEYPSGVYASEARQKMSDLEIFEKQRLADAERERSMAGSLNFHVQIAASKKPIPEWKIKMYYKGPKEIVTKHYDIWYKYSIGDFKTYEEAKSFVKKIKVRGAFVVAYKNDKKIDIKEAINN